MQQINSREAIIKYFSTQTQDGRPIGDERAEQMYVIIASQPCILCQAPPHVVVLYFPEDSTLLGAGEGKTRVVPYNLCNKCIQKQDASDIVEEMIHRDFRPAH
jgi:hypothetical protein